MVSVGAAAAGSADVIADDLRNEASAAEGNARRLLAADDVIDEDLLLDEELISELDEELIEEQAEDQLLSAVADDRDGVSRLTFLSAEGCQSDHTASAAEL
jgi:hypothetical protein